MTSRQRAHALCRASGYGILRGRWKYGVPSDSSLPSSCAELGPKIPREGRRARGVIAQCLLVSTRSGHSDLNLNIASHP